MAYQLNQEQAEFIKELRCSKDYSWRAVARDFTEKYPDIEPPTSNQWIGMELCSAAMKFLGETVEQGWN